MEQQKDEKLVSPEKDALIPILNRFVTFSVKTLAVLIVIVMFWGLMDVIAHLYMQLFNDPVGRFDTDQLLEILGSFLGVLIIIEVFLNIVFYLKKDAVHVPLVLATGLTAISRKIIVIDYQNVQPFTMFGIAAVIFATGIVYWLVAVKEN